MTATSDRPLWPSEIRRRILDEHADVRVLVNHALDAAQAAVVLGKTGIPALCEAATALYIRLRNHMAYEEAVLVPALRDADAWGEQRVQAFLAEHQVQRTVLAKLIALGNDATKTAAELAGRVVLLVGRIKADMDEEEREVLDPNLLRDDLVVVAVTG
jgi:hypothetical protein